MAPTKRKVDLGTSKPQCQETSEVRKFMSSSWFLCAKLFCFALQNCCFNLAGCGANFFFFTRLLRHRHPLATVMLFSSPSNFEAAEGLKIVLYSTFTERSRSLPVRRKVPSSSSGLLPLTCGWKCVPSTQNTTCAAVSKPKTLPVQHPVSHSRVFTGEAKDESPASFPLASIYGAYEPGSSMYFRLIFHPSPTTETLQPNRLFPRKYD